jgi:uncharacterized protein YndB with AHSA1/START domain
MRSPDPSPTVIEPIRLTTRIPKTLEGAFDLFARNMTAWWPLDRFSFDPARSCEVHLDPFPGGRFYERYRDGDEHQIGQVLRWEPPARVTFTWRHHDWVAPTEVDVVFIAEDAIVTRIELEHRAWERLGAIGARLRDEYSQGWVTIIGHFTTYADAA